MEISASREHPSRSPLKLLILMVGLTASLLELPMLTTLSTEKVAVQAAKLLGAIANARRLVILDIISRQETSVGSLAEQVGLSQSALSQHLAKLRGAKLVDTRRDAQTIYYSCNSDVANRLLGTVHEILGWPLRPVVIGNPVSSSTVKRQMAVTPT